MQTDRENFKSNIGFILVTAGSAVGLGNLVVFPVSATNGGGAFLLLYLLFVFAVCVPIMVAEVALGRYTRSSPLAAYTAIGGKYWAIGGLLAVVTPFMIAVAYQVISIWVMGYLFFAAGGQLTAMAQDNFHSQFTASYDVWFFMLTLIVVLGTILWRGIEKGIEIIAKYMMPLLFLLLVFLVGYVVSLDGAMKGIKYYLLPDWSKINGNVANKALSQAFFSLSLGMGILITMGSYLKSKANINRDTKWVAIADSSVAFFAGLLIMPAIFIFSPQTDPDNLSTSALSLIFDYIPKLMLQMSMDIGIIPATIFLTVFFLLLFIAAVTSQLSILQVSIASLQDHFQLSRRSAVSILMGVLLLLSGYALVDTGFFATLVSIFYDTVLPLNGFILCLFVIFCWRFEQMDTELAKGEKNYMSSWQRYYINGSIKTFIPVILLFLFVNTFLQVWFDKQLF